jgi:hypothetical protein
MDQMNRLSEDPRDHLSKNQPEIDPREHLPKHKAKRSTKLSTEETNPVWHREQELCPRKPYTYSLKPQPTNYFSSQQTQPNFINMKIFIVPKYFSQLRRACLVDKFEKKKKIFHDFDIIIKL